MLTGNKLLKEAWTQDLVYNEVRFVRSCQNFSGRWQRGQPCRVIMLVRLKDRRAHGLAVSLRLGRGNAVQWRDTTAVRDPESSSEPSFNFFIGKMTSLKSPS